MSIFEVMPYFLLNDKLRGFIDKCETVLDASTDQEKVNLREKLIKLKADDKIDLRIIQKINEILNRNKDEVIYLHEIIENCELYLPKYEPVPRNPELEKRCQELRNRFENEKYQEMVKNVGYSSKSSVKQANSSTDIRTINGQIIAILNVILVIGGAFVFGYKSVEYSLAKPNHLWQISGGLLLALIVAIADFYFLFKKLLKVEKLEEDQTHNKKIN